MRELARNASFARASEIVGETVGKVVGEVIGEAVGEVIGEALGEAIGEERENEASSWVSSVVFKSSSMLLGKSHGESERERGWPREFGRLSW